MRFFSFILKEVLNFLFPKSQTVAKLETLTTSELLRILPGAERPHDKDVTPLFEYRDPLVREMVWELKYRGNRLVAEKLGNILYDLLLDEMAERGLYDNWSNPLLVPMPISDKRRNDRGWNQAEILAEAIMKNDKENRLFKYVPRQLVKHRHTESQTRTSSRQERFENLEHSMKILHPEVVKDRPVVLVDDVYTTGATFKEAKRALKEAGVKGIILITAAH